MRIFIVVVCLIIAACSIQAQVSYSARDNAPLIDILQDIQNIEGVLFAYEDENVEGYYINLGAGAYTLDRYLQAIFSQTKLQYKYLDSIHILIHKISAKDVTICGTILDSYTKEAISFANVYSNDKSAIVSSDVSGAFDIKASNQLDHIVISYLGYHDHFIPITASKYCDTIYLKPNTVDLPQVVLVEYLADGISQPNDESTIVIQTDEMDILPGAVDKDILTTIQFLPGISSSTESFDNINIRGGTPDQNQILWDHIPVYQTSHFFGNISAFNPFIIDHVDIYRSGIDSRFGGRVSSVIDIKSKNDLKDGLTIGAGSNLTHAHFELGTPLWKNSSIWLSTRRSISDLSNTPTFLSYADKVFQGTKVEDVRFNGQNNDKFLFNDANLQWRWKIGNNDFQISTLGGLNSLAFDTELPQLRILTTDDLKIASGGASFRWSKKINTSLDAEFILTSSSYRNDYNLTTSEVQSGIDLPFFLKSSNKLEDGGLSLNFDYVFKQNQALEFGYQYTNNTINFITNTKDLGLKTNQDSLFFKSKVHALFGDYTLDIANVIKLDIGLRYLRNTVINNDYFEPRLSATTKVTDYLKLKIGTSKHFQFVNQLVIINANTLGLSNKIWVASNNNTIPVTESNNWMGGLLYQKNGWTIDLEGYVKELVGITSLSSDLDNQPFSQGSSRIRGVDILIKKKINNVRSWLSYSLSETLYEFANISPMPFYATHDQTHSLQWVNMLKYGRWEFSIGVQYRTGLPTTDANKVDTKLNSEGDLVPYIVYDDVHGSRLKDYLRLDASIIYNFILKDLCIGYLGFSIQNLSDRMNINNRRYIIGDQTPQAEYDLIDLDQTGLRFTPNLTANILF